MYNGVYDIDQFAYLHTVLMKWVELKIKGSTLGERLVNKGIKEISIYGINDFGKLVYKDIENSVVNIKCFIDQKADNYSNGFEGIPVFKPNTLPDSVKDSYILITPEFYFYEILEALVRAEIPYENITSISMLV